MMNNKQLWDSVLLEVELGLSKANFTTWFKDTYIQKQENGVVCVSVPNQFVKDWLQKKYHKLILTSLRNAEGSVRSIEYIIEKGRGGRPEETGVKIGGARAGELPLNDFYINKEDNLNSRYTFDSFVVGSFNELAYAAAQAVVGNPGVSYNPLFIYGQTGHGKTHLIQAIGNQIKKNNPNKKVYYLTTEKFLIDFLNSVQSNNVNGLFKEKYRKYDILIMDDIQFIGNKERSQEELFHLFNTLYNNNKQIVFSSDQHPNLIPGLENRLKSRFNAGMTVDIPAPDQESRVVIIRSKCKANNFELPDDIVEYLAGTLNGNIRELEGALNTIICHTQLKNKVPNVADIKELIKNSIKPQKNVSTKDVVKLVSDFYGINESSIYEKTRKKEVVKPRQIIMYILREDFSISFPTIGQRLGGRDHTTVIHSYEKIKNDLKINNTLAQEINHVRSMI